MLCGGRLYIANLFGYDMHPSAIPPFCTAERFSDLAGVTVDVVRAWIARGYLPTKKIGKYRLVDVVAMSSLQSIALPDGMSPAGTGTPSRPARKDGRRQAPSSGQADGAPPSKHGVSSVGHGGSEGTF